MTASNFLSELVVGALAGFLGVLWPRPAIIDLLGPVQHRLSAKGLHVTSPVAVGTVYMEGLRDVPDGGSWRERMERSFPVPERCSAFYGKAILDKWTGMSDAKFDQVKIGPDGAPVFLDGDASDIALLHEAGLREALIASLGTESFTLDATAPYLEEILTERCLFLSWLERLEAFSLDHMQILSESIPVEFLPPDVGPALSNVLLMRKERMLEFLKPEAQAEE